MTARISSSDELLTALEAARNTALGTEEHLIADSDVAGKTHLTAKHTPFAYLCTACYTYLRRHHGVGTDIGIVGNLYEVVELYALANIGRTHCSTSAH